MNTSSEGSVPHCTSSWGSPHQKAQWSLPLNTDKWNISLLQKPSIKESTAKKGSEQWARMAYNASHSSLTAAKTPALASNGHGQTRGKKPKEGRKGKKSCHSFRTITSLQPLQLIQLPEHAWWRVEVFTGVGTPPRSHQLQLHRSGQIQGFRTVILLHNLYHAIFELGMAWWICSRLYPAGFHEPTPLPCLFPSGKTFWTLEQVVKMENLLGWKKYLCVCVCVCVFLPHLPMLTFQHVNLWTVTTMRHSWISDNTNVKALH